MKSIKTFWSRVEVKGPDECWNYTGWCGPDGYGVFQPTGEWWLAHRFAWAVTNGPIPDGMVVRHSCDNPPCCNPKHLCLGSHTDNVADKVSKDRQAKGLTHGRNKLTEDAVKAIYFDPRPNSDIAREHGVDPAAVRSIKTHKNWRHLTQRWRPRPDSNRDVTA